MEIDKWRVKNKLSYENLGRLLNLTTSKTYRICKHDPCVKLMDAHCIVTVTKGEVSYADLLPEGC